MPAEFMESWSRWPTAAERRMFNIPEGTDIPMNIYSQAYRIHAGERQFLAGVMVLARGDRVGCGDGGSTKGWCYGSQTRTCRPPSQRLIEVIGALAKRRGTRRGGREQGETSLYPS
jgi:hypothetical protein